MTHVATHCGRVGTEAGQDGPHQWPRFQHFIVAWKLTADPDKKDKLEKQIERRALKMALAAQSEFGGEVTELMIEGGYCAIGVGKNMGDVTIPAFDIASDFLVTYAFDSGDMSHARASALDTWFNIQRYKMYLDVHDVTGGEIHIAY